MTKILITGGAGYVGDAVVRELAYNPKCQVTVYDNLTYGGSYMRGAINPPFVDFVGADIRNYGLLRSCIEDSDVVIHLAAVVGDGACAANPDRTVDINEKATKFIAEQCHNVGATLLFASTCSVYGANNDLLDEESATNPLSIYAGTKLKAEEYVRQVDKHYIFRLGTLFGLSSELARIRADLVANILTYRAVRGETLNVFGGEQYRPLLHVRDVGDIISDLATCPDRPFGTYILGYSNYTIREVAEATGSNKIEITDMKFEDLRNYRVTTKKADENGLLKPKISLKQGIEEMKRVLSSGRIADVWNPIYHNARYTKEILNG